MTRTSARRKKRRRPSRAEIAARADRILRTEPHYIYNSSFDAPGAEREILGPPPKTTAPARRGPSTEGTDFYVAFLYQSQLLSRDEERYLFRKMNYLKFRAHRLRQPLDPERATAAQVKKIESLELEAERIRNHIVESNLRLVTARAKHFARTTGLPLDELISEGNIGLVQAVEHFDFSRGTKLSTYATWAITNKMLAYLRWSQRESGHRMSGPGICLDGVESDWTAADDAVAESEERDKLTSLLGNLKDRERTAVEHRFGLTEDAEVRTLKELANQWGVTKQRAQQVCAGAVSKLRVLVEEAGIEPPEQ
jgi:RNA polymerase sigma factor (sigma-70 family)